MSTMRIMGLDLGERRVGVAVSDELGMLAHPVATLEIQGDRALLEQVGALVHEKGVTRLVVGLPLNQDGSVGPRAQRVQDLARKLAAATDLPVDEVDERFSSQAAQRILDQAPRKKTRQEKGRLDRIAAVIILQSYLDQSR
jgi:putative Holliday junction resolvase